MGAPGKAILSQEIGLGAPRVRSGRPNLRPKPAVNRDEGAQVAGTIPNLRPKPAENRDEGAQVAGTIPNLRPKPAENRAEGGAGLRQCRVRAAGPGEPGGGVGRDGWEGAADVVVAREGEGAVAARPGRAEQGSN